MVLTMSMHVLNKAAHQMQRRTDFWASLVATKSPSITSGLQALYVQHTYAGTHR